jgi:hypothetical protein
VLRAAQDAAEERVRHVRNQKGDRSRRAEPQSLRGRVRPVAQLAGAAAHALLGRLGHSAAALPGEDQGDGRLRHVGAAGDVDARDAMVARSFDAGECNHAHSSGVDR